MSVWSANWCHNIRHLLKLEEVYIFKFLDIRTCRVVYVYYDIKMLKTYFFQMVMMTINCALKKTLFTIAQNVKNKRNRLHLMFRITGITEIVLSRYKNISYKNRWFFYYYLLCEGNLHNFVSINTIFLHNKMRKMIVWHTRKVSHKSNYDLMNIYTLVVESPIESACYERHSVENYNGTTVNHSHHHDALIKFIKFDKFSTFYVVNVESFLLSN